MFPIHSFPFVIFHSQLSDENAMERLSFFHCSVLSFVEKVEVGCCINYRSHVWLDFLSMDTWMSPYASSLIQPIIQLWSLLFLHPSHASISIRFPSVCSSMAKVEEPDPPGHMDGLRVSERTPG